MKSIKDVAKAVNQVIAEAFPGVSIKSTDIDKDVKKPCFFTEYDMTRDGTPDFIHDYGKVIILYFPRDSRKNRLELMEAQSKLAEAFFCRLKVDETFYIPINELEFDISNDVLTLEFEIEMYQRPEKEPGILMEEIGINEEV